MPMSQPLNRYRELEAHEAIAYLCAVLAKLERWTGQVDVPYHGDGPPGAGLLMEPAAVQLLSTYARLIKEYPGNSRQCTITTGAALLPRASPVIVAVEVGYSHTFPAWEHILRFWNGPMQGYLPPGMPEVTWRLSTRYSTFQNVKAFEELITHNIDGFQATSAEELFGSIADYLYSAAASTAPAPLPDACMEHIGRLVLRQYVDALQRENEAFRSITRNSVIDVLSSWRRETDLGAMKTERVLVHLATTPRLFISHQAKRAKDGCHPEEMKCWQNMIANHNGEHVAVFGPDTYEQWAQMLAYILEKIHNCTARVEREAFEQLFPHIEVLWNIAYPVKRSTEGEVKSFDIFERLLSDESIGLGDHLRRNCVHSATGAGKSIVSQMLHHLRQIGFYGSAGRTIVSAYRALPTTMTAEPIAAITIQGKVHKQLGVRPTDDLFRDFVDWLESELHITSIPPTVLEQGLRPSDDSFYPLDIHGDSVLRAVRELRTSTGLCNGPCCHYDGRCTLYREIFNDSAALSGLRRPNPNLGGTQEACAASAMALGLESVESYGSAAEISSADLHTSIFYERSNAEHFLLCFGYEMELVSLPSGAGRPTGNVIIIARNPSCVEADSTPSTKVAIEWKVEEISVNSGGSKELIERLKTNPNKCCARNFQQYASNLFGLLVYEDELGAMRMGEVNEVNEATADIEHPREPEYPYVLEYALRNCLGKMKQRLDSCNRPFQKNVTLWQLLKEWHQTKSVLSVTTETQSGTVRLTETLAVFIHWLRERDVHLDDTAVDWDGIGQGSRGTPTGSTAVFGPMNAHVWAALLSYLLMNITLNIDLMMKHDIAPDEEHRMDDSTFLKVSTNLSAQIEVLSSFFHRREAEKGIMSPSNVLGRLLGDGKVGLIVFLESKTHAGFQESGTNTADDPNRTTTTIEGDTSALEEEQSMLIDADGEDENLGQLGTMVATTLNNLCGFLFAAREVKKYYDPSSDIEGLNPSYFLISGEKTPKFFLTKEEVEKVKAWAASLPIDKRAWHGLKKLHMFLSKAPTGVTCTYHCESILMATGPDIAVCAKKALLAHPHVFTTDGTHGLGFKTRFFGLTDEVMRLYSDLVLETIKKKDSGTQTQQSSPNRSLHGGGTPPKASMNAKRVFDVDEESEEEIF
ncbi:hypothetical protein CALCODRAFT_507398 [Calocera cornea HHB12733]|uniref:Uncharacterized protein n=1 Tax=Calocera cornea HHB12733 TaxID=1353952 RepID=A0A165HSM5_9BASI|nr:hypothetical protein CALCODRAFT_507398 [Calocera cornea HHB12733]